MAKRAVSERGSFPRSTFWVRSLLACTVVALTLGGGAISAHAQDGEKIPGVSGEFADTEGVFAARCQDLRTITGLLGGDVVVVCDTGGEQCHLFSSTAIDEGPARGYCPDSVDGVHPFRGGVGVPLEDEVVVDATTLITDIGITDVGVVGSTGDIVCETFDTTTTTTGKKGTSSSGSTVCVKVFPGNCPAGGCLGGGINVRSDPDRCNTVKALLAASVTSAPFPSIAYWKFIDLQMTGKKEGQVVSVCPGFAWRFLPLSEPIADEANVEYQRSMSVIQADACFNNGNGGYDCFCTSPDAQCWNTTFRRNFCDRDPTPPNPTPCDGCTLPKRRCSNAAGKQFCDDDTVCDGL